jgi:hypothetical protein
VKGFRDRQATKASHFCPLLWRKKNMEKITTGLTAETKKAIADHIVTCINAMPARKRRRTALKVILLFEMTIANMRVVREVA